MQAAVLQVCKKGVAWVQTYVRRTRRVAATGTVQAKESFWKSIPNVRDLSTLYV